MNAVSETIIRSCLYNWLGYGKLNSPVWIVGVEEGVLQINSGKQTLESSLSIRSRFTLSMDFRQVWEEHFGIHPIRGSSPWNFLHDFYWNSRTFQRLMQLYNPLYKINSDELMQTISLRFSATSQAG